MRVTKSKQLLFRHLNKEPKTLLSSAQLRTAARFRIPSVFQHGSNRVNIFHVCIPSIQILSYNGRYIHAYLSNKVMPAGW